MQVGISAASAGAGQHGDVKGLSGFVFALFFVFGGITSLNDVLIPKLKGLFSLSYGEAMLVQSAFFIGYLVISIPAALLVNRIGYMRAATVGLLAMAIGCLVFLPRRIRPPSPRSSVRYSWSRRGSPSCRSSPTL